MPRYLDNTFNPRTQTGTTMQTLANAMFGTGMTPNDMTKMGVYRSQAEENRAQARKYGAEADAMERKYEQSDPSRIPEVVGMQTGIPSRDVEQYQQFIRNGVPYARPDFGDDSVSATVRNLLGAYQSLPFMEGKTNYDQFMSGVSTGAEEQRMGMTERGEMDPRDFAQLQGAREGKPMVDIKQGYSFDPYGRPGEETQLPIAEALANYRNAGANYRNAQTTNERAGTPGDPEGIGSSDMDVFEGILGRLLQQEGLMEEQGYMGQAVPTIDEHSYNNILKRGAQLFRDPQSPYQGNHADAVAAAFQEAMQMKESRPAERGWIAELFNYGPEEDTFIPELGPRRGSQPSPGRPMQQEAPAGNAAGQEWMEDLPDPSELPDEAKAVDDDGNRYITRGGRWIRVDS